MKFIDNILEIVDRVCSDLDKLENKGFYVDNRQLLRHLKDYEINIPKNFFDIYKDEFGNGVLQYMESVSNESIDNFSGGNTYNYSGKIYYDLDYRICETKDEHYLVAIQTHTGGDVRANYTDFFLLQFDYDTEFYEIIDDFCRNSCYFEFEYMNKEFYVNPQVFNEHLEIWNKNDDEYIYTVWADNITDLENQLNEFYKNK